MFHRYYKGVIIPLLLIVSFIFAAIVDGGAEVGNYAEQHTARVQTIVTLDNGETFVVEEATKEVTVNTYNLSNPANWDIINY